jgi:hypothetical protein
VGSSTPIVLKLLNFLFQNLQPNERWIYEEEARKVKGRDKNDLELKFTTQGKSYAQIEREKNEAYGQQIRMIQEIEGTVRSLDYSTCEFNSFGMLEVLA